MAKIKTRFVCNNCGSVSTRWLGRCPQCGEWNTLVEEQTVPQTPKGVASSVRSEGTEPELLKSVRMESMSRLQTGIDELDTVLGGGIVPGALILLSGDPGIGKSTLVLQTAAAVSREAGTVLSDTSRKMTGSMPLKV